MKIIEKNSLVIVFCVAVATLFWGIWGVPLLDPDEPVYAETAREMIEFKDFLSPRIYNEYWYDKPPMYYWLVAIAQYIFGFNEFAARFPAALMASATSVMVYVGGAKLFNERAGFWASLVLTSCIQFFYMGKAAVTDTTLLFFMTGALLSFIHKRYWLMYICMALATLTKGPIGIVFPGAIIFLYILCMGRLDEILRMHVIRGLLLYFLIAAPWYYAMYTVHGMEFIDTFLGFHNVTRFTTPEHANRVTFWYYIPVVILGLFPWTGLFVLSIRSSIGESRVDDMRNLIFLHIWWAFVFLFFTVCKTKLVSYILPMFPAMAMVIGWYIAWVESKTRYNKVLWSWIFGSGIMYLLLGAGWIVGAKFLSEVSASLIILGIVTLILGAAVIIAIYYYKDVQLASFIHVATGIVTMVVAFTFVLPVLADRFSMKTIAAFYKQECYSHLPVHVDKFLRPGFMWYTRAPGKEMLPKTDDFKNALQKEGWNYYVVRGLELRRFQKTNQLPESVTVLKEAGDIYLLQKLQETK
ncbi:MAG: glycosyltransferase family 39 protein [Phascolarctobacterium sp.]|nr:glycosyltransferase family 39 protein [Phascolarctobacterium sp.]